MVKQAKALLQQGKLAESKCAVERLLAEEPDDVEGLYLLAVCQRYQKAFSGAVATLQRLLSLNPDYASAYQEMGHLNRLSGALNEAVDCYRRAVSLNPALVASWKELARLHRVQGDIQLAEQAQAQENHFANMPPSLRAVTSLIHEGDLYRAEQLCREFLQKNRHHLEAMRLLAQIAVKLEVLDDAEFLLESCTELDPRFQQARYDYVDVLHRRQKFEKALEQARLLRDSNRENPAFETAYARENLAVGNFETALASYEALIAKTPNNPYTFMVRGHALKTVGRQEEAIESYRRAVAFKPDLGDAFWSLANLKTYRFSDAEIAHMLDYVSRPATPVNEQYHLCFALGKAYEDRQQFDEAFNYYYRGNRLKQSELRYSADRSEAECKLQMELCNSDLFEKHRGAGCSSSAPIFVVGLPRSGSTLLEQILASHQQVDGTMELPNILALAHRLGGRRRVNEAGRYPAVLHELSPEQLTQFGEEYLRDTEIYREGAPFFTDKMPNNFRHIGLIQLMFPNARIIDARRHPMACCFSGFKQLFAEGQAFTYGLEEIGRYYRDYVALMDHWDSVLPGKILCMQYEEVVNDFEYQVRRLLDFCELPFDDACLNFYRTNRSVRTASSEQVRQPLYHSGLGQWRNFEPHLQPLKAALGEEILTRYPLTIDG